jgi:chromosome segregation ATPase
MTNNIKNPSPLVETVLKLDNYLAEIVRLGEKIEAMQLKSDFDYDQAQKLMARFTECGQGVAEEVVQLSANLNTARAKAEAAAQVVAEKAEQLQARQDQHHQKMADFRALGEKVRDLTMSLNDLKRPEGQELTDDDRAQVSMRLSEFQLRLQPLIDEALKLKQEAQTSKLKTLEQGADSLVQSLSAIGKRLQAFNTSDLASH